MFVIQLMKKITLLLTLVVSLSIYAQKKGKIISLENLSITEQLDEIYKKSSSWEDYKVIKKVKYKALEKNIIRFIDGQKKTIEDKESIIQGNKTEIDQLNQQLIGVNNNLEASIIEKDRRSIFGIPVDKTLFSIIIISVYALLAALLSFFAFKYKQNLGVTKKAVANLNDLEIEFEEHKKTSLRRLQETNRKLQDELNRNWKKEK